MKIKEFIKILIEYGLHSDRYNDSDVYELETFFNEMEYDELQDCFYHYCTSNEDDTIECKNRFDLLRSLTLSYYEISYMVRGNDLFEYNSLQKSNGEMRKVLHRKNHKNQIEGKCACGDDIYNYSYKIKIEMNEKQKKDIAFMGIDEEDKTLYYCEAQVEKYQCENCGKLYSAKDVCMLSYSSIVSATKPSTIFYEKDKIIISTFKHIYESVKCRVVYRQNNYRIVFNLKTGRQYVMPILDKYNKRKHGIFKSVNAYSWYMSYNMEQGVHNLTKEDFMKIGETIESYINDENAIPFAEYCENIDKDNKYLNSIYTIKVLTAYNANPYVPFDEYMKILELKDRIRESKERIKANIYNKVHDGKGIKGYDKKLVRNRDLLKQHHEFVEELKISDEYRQIVKKEFKEYYERMKNQSIPCVVPEYNENKYDDVYNCDVLVLLSNETKAYNRIKDDKKLMEKIELTPELNVKTFVNMLNHEMFTKMSPSLFKKYAYMLAKEAVLCAIEGNDIISIERKITAMAYHYYDIISLNPDYTIKELYTIDELKDKLSKDKDKYSNADYEITYNDTIMKAFNTRSIRLVKTVGVNSVYRSFSVTSIYSVSQLLRGDAIYVQYTNKDGKKYYLYLSSDDIKYKHIPKRITKLFEKHKKEIKKELQVTIKEV